MDVLSLKRHATLVLFPLFARPEVDHRCCRRLNNYWDYPVQEHLDINSYYETLLTYSPTNKYFWVLDGNTKDIVGLTGIQHHPKYQTWHTTSMISEPQRGQGIYTYLTLMHAGVFKSLGEPLYTTIKTDNLKAAKILNNLDLPPEAVNVTLERPYNYNTNPVTPAGVFNEQEHIHYTLSDVSIMNNPTMNNNHHKQLRPIYEHLIEKVKRNPAGQNITESMV